MIMTNNNETMKWNNNIEMINEMKWMMMIIMIMI